MNSKKYVMKSIKHIVDGVDSWIHNASEAEVIGHIVLLQSRIEDKDEDAMIELVAIIKYIKDEDK